MSIIKRIYEAKYKDACELAIEMLKETTSSKEIREIEFAISTHPNWKKCKKHSEIGRLCYVKKYFIKHKINPKSSEWKEIISIEGLEQYEKVLSSKGGKNV